MRIINEPEGTHNPRTSFDDFLKDYVGKNIAVLCARFWYRGKLTSVSASAVILNPAMQIDVTGRNENDKPEMEDPMRGPVCIRTEFIEQVCFPNWVNASYPQLEEYDHSERKNKRR